MARVITREFLGSAFWRGAGGKLRRRVADKALEAMKNRVREITGRSRGRRVRQVVEALRRYLTGWRAYFCMAETPEDFRSLDEWIRHRLRQIHLKHWKTAKRAHAEFRARGASEELARRVGVGVSGGGGGAAAGRQGSVDAHYRRGLPRRGTRRHWRLRSQKGGRGGEGIWVLDREDKLKPEVAEMLELVAQHDAILGTCHLSPREIVAPVRAAHDLGIQKVVVTHPFFKVPSLDLPTLEEIVRLGGMPEFGYCTISPAWQYASQDKVVQAISWWGRRAACW